MMDGMGCSVMHGSISYVCTIIEKAEYNFGEDGTFTHLGLGGRSFVCHKFLSLPKQQSALFNHGMCILHGFCKKFMKYLSFIALVDLKTWSVLELKYLFLLL